MINKKELAIVKDYEREKIYRLNRRLDGLQELLETIDNTKIKFLDSQAMKKNIEKDISECESRIQTWWNIIVQKYNLPVDQTFVVSFANGCIYEN